MQIYPFTSPIILNDIIFAQYGGKIGPFTREQLDAAYHIAEQQVSTHVGTLLLPHIVTGTYIVPVTFNQKRIATDYGYVSRLLQVVVKTQKVNSTDGCVLEDNSGCAFIYRDTFGYLDVYKTSSVCGCTSTSDPYLYEITYEAGLPTGTANLPSVLAALTLAAQVVLNDLYPGVVGMNEGVGDVGIQEFESFTYHERRTAHALRRNSFGGSAMANRIAVLLDSAVRKARRSLRL